MHGEWPVKAGTPCTIASGSFIDAWGMVCKGWKPMHFNLWELHKCMGNGCKGWKPMQGSLRKLLICMGVGTKRLDPHAKA